MAQGLDASALRWQPELAALEPWRCVTAAWVHLSRLHLLANLAGTALVAALGVASGCGKRATLAWALAWPLTQLGLMLQPMLTRYGGLSGVLHAGVAVAAWQLLREPPSGLNGRPPFIGHRLIGAALLLGLGVKIVLEAPWLRPLRQVPGWDINIAPLAHATGAVAGLLCAVLCSEMWRPARGRVCAVAGQSRRDARRRP